jgi:16S rRNA (guanine966-N2)-methyltransferase
VRIIAGEWRNRRIVAPPGRAVRPTPERVREAWMSIVQPVLPGSRVLDLFAGTGALGLEALSRGAAWAEFVESDPRSLRIIEQNITTLAAGSRCHVNRQEAVKYVERLPAGAAPVPFGVCFADPPYRTGLAGRLAELWLERPFAAIFGVEHEAGEALPDGGDRRRYGDTAITFYRT